MFVDHRLPSLDAAPGRRCVDLLDARVCRLQSVEALLEERAEPLVRLNGIHEECVAARVWPVEQVEEGCPRGLLLVRHVRVPGGRARTSLKEGLVTLVLGTAVDEVDLGVSLRGARCRVNVVTPKVAAILEGLGDGQVREVLAAECDHLALGYEQGELILAGLVQRAELDAADLRTDAWGQVADLDTLAQQVRERRIGVLAVLIMLELGQGRILLLGIPGREVVGVLLVVVSQCCHFSGFLDT